MATEIKTKTPEQVEQKGGKSKGANTALWLVAIVFLAVAAVGNAYFSSHFSLIVRVLLLVVLLVGAVALAAITNQGQKAIHFIKESRTELRKIIWPTRPEATQTTLIVLAMCVVVSLVLWGIDSIIVALITFVTSLRF
ncbi:TPA: preprotein translocase subunit SecE [Mannheimia haemolytica]|uniref:Protein translocase subunit SecE n=1 Tax=Mannheimia haemolytica TaxID=75985 RepID=A0A248ZWE2_MANHA|nr:preprotein translocase subunit SecE [Mannheimia haemolytica]AWW70451.1 preprotein translocase subunit SecE [Pasteurellaceae bacterium 12565]AGI31481.1 preprotein translocase subunit SecE [Mannheimia haemolytica USDA-ARS-USMARC-183]AGI36410.1 preprotein translocase subunit SecE [Mannheimia haemolytica USDA-ARS-USMARC-185]AGK00877.1 secretory pathway preprotein translocase protein SecE [Mannheimia haemolytica M42548]AGQ26041.1 preprotein translocase subunit SecE [Mannheimia haemolytica D153]